MTVVSVTYPQKPDATFDFDYYLHKHIPMVQALLNDAGLQKLDIFKGSSLVDGSPAKYILLALLAFGSPEECQSAMGEHGEKINADIPNFTDSKPVMQINEQLEADIR